MRRPAARLDQVFFALSDPTRRAIVGSLAGGPRTVGELGEPFPISAPAISKHLKILERSGLISRRVRGRHHLCALESRGLREAEDWVRFYRRFWEARLDELEKMLEAPDRAPVDESDDPSEQEAR